MSPELLDASLKLLQSQHKIEHPEGMPWLQFAIIEHNVLAAAKLYHNITFTSLARLLSVSVERVRVGSDRVPLSQRVAKTPHGSLQAEEIATKMILESRIKAVIDQVNGVLEFSSGTVCGRCVM